MSAKTKSRIIFIACTLVIGTAIIMLFGHSQTDVTCGGEFMQQGDTCTTKNYGSPGDGYTSDYSTQKNAQQFSLYGFCYFLGAVVTMIGMGVGRAVMRKRARKAEHSLHSQNEEKTSSH